MAAEDLAAKRYAQAAFELAAEANSLEQWGAALERIAAFMTDPEVSYILENSRIPQESKQRLVAAGLSDLPALPYNLARLLVRKGRTALARAIANIYTQLAEERAGVERAVATTAVAMGEAEREALLQRIERETGRRVVLKTEVDPQILGGLRLQIGDQLVDASTRAKLERLREALVNAV